MIILYYYKDFKSAINNSSKARIKKIKELNNIILDTEKFKDFSYSILERTGKTENKYCLKVAYLINDIEFYKYLITD
jgi:hypothetical protein